MLKQYDLYMANANADPCDIPFVTHPASLLPTSIPLLLNF